MYLYIFTIYSKHHFYSNFINSYSEITEENKKRQIRRVAKKCIVKGDKLYFNAGESQPLVIKECELTKYCQKYTIHINVRSIHII